MENEIRMYAEADFERSRSEKSGMIRRMLLCALPFLAGAAAAFAVRHEPLCIACMIAFGMSLAFPKVISLMGKEARAAEAE